MNFNLIILSLYILVVLGYCAKAISRIEHLKEEIEIQEKLK